MAVTRTHDNRDCCGHESRGHSRRLAATAHWIWLSVQYKGPVSCGASTMITTGVDMNVDAAFFKHAAAAVTYCGPSQHVAPAPVVENMIPVTAGSCASPARAVNAAPAPDVECVSPGSPAPTVYAVPARVGPASKERDDTHHKLKSCHPRRLYIFFMKKM